MRNNTIATLNVFIYYYSTKVVFFLDIIKKILNFALRINKNYATCPN